MLTPNLLDRDLADSQLLMEPVVLTELLSAPKVAGGIARTLSELPLIDIKDGYWQRAGALKARVLAKRRKARLDDALIAQSCIDCGLPLLTRDGKNPPHPGDFVKTEIVAPPVSRSPLPPQPLGFRDGHLNADAGFLRHSPNAQARAMRRFPIALCFLLAIAAAERHVWQPAGQQQLSLWPGTPPGATAGPDEETVETVADEPVAGKPWTDIGKVSRPTMTIYAPKGSNTGAGVVVFPGGGYQILAIDLEGTEVCDWLTSKGVTCVLLKYRVPDSGPHWDKSCDCQVTPKIPAALQDAQRAVGLLRLHAKEWHIDPHKLGVLGFSAGGFLCADISNHFDKRAYAPVDAADRESCRPDFAVAIYPGHLWTGGHTLGLNPSIHPTRDTPPTFLLQAENDNVDNVNQALTYYIALKNAGVPTEMHRYAAGGHAFGLRRTKLPITAWPQLVETWLGTIGVL